MTHERGGMGRPSTTITTCTVCERRGAHIAHCAAEQMFGRGDSFIYLECPNCGSLALKDVPPSLSDYYPDDYYSFVDRGRSKQSRAAAVIRGSAMTLLLRSRGIGNVIVACSGLLGTRVEPWIHLLGGSDLDLGSRVLDVGCGNGHRLRTFRRFGFRHLMGIDAHLPLEVEEPGGIVLSRMTLGDVEGIFDLIMFHHSFEHMRDPLGVLRTVYRLLAPGGLLLLRIPLAGTWAWRTYGVDWVQLDAPRHLFLYTATGVGMLARRAGLELRRTVYDSGPLQFWGSELYRAGTSLQASGSVEGAPPPTVPRLQVEEWELRAAQLNAKSDGDQAAFLFTKGLP